MLHRPFVKWMCDHQVMGRIVCPGAAYMEMSGCVSEMCNGTMGTELRSVVHDASIPMPLTLTKPQETQDGFVSGCELSLLLDMRQGELQIRSTTSVGGGSGLHLRALISMVLVEEEMSFACAHPMSQSPEIVRAQCEQSVNNVAMYSSLHKVGLQYGPCFQVVSSVNVHSGGKFVLGCLSGSNSTDESGMHVSPALLDGCMHLSVCLHAASSSSDSSSGAKVPAGFSAYCNVLRLSSSSLFGIAEGGSTPTSKQMDATLSSHYLMNMHGSMLSRLHDLQAKFISPQKKMDYGKAMAKQAMDQLYVMQWQTSHVQSHSLGSDVVGAHPHLFGVHASKVLLQQNLQQDDNQGYMHGTGAFLSLAQALGSASGKHLLLKTFGSMLEVNRDIGCERSSNMAMVAASIRGMLRSIRVEQANGSWSCVDFGPGETDQSTSAWWDENEGSEIVQRGKTTHVIRLLSHACVPPSGLVQIVPHPRGALSNLTTDYLQLERPPQGTVLVEVLSVGLNFRDVLNVLGAYPGDPGPPGSDVSGVVAQVHSGYESITVGSAVAVLHLVV
jgi:hypothetical protein